MYIGKEILISQSVVSVCHSVCPLGSNVTTHRPVQTLSLGGPYTHWSSPPDLFKFVHLVKQVVGLELKGLVAKYWFYSE